MNDVGERLVFVRKARKWGRQQLADALGLTVAKVANIERGRDLKPDEEAAIVVFLDQAGELDPSGGQASGPADLDELPGQQEAFPTAPVQEFPVPTLTEDELDEELAALLDTNDPPAPSPIIPSGGEGEPATVETRDDQGSPASVDVLQPLVDEFDDGIRRLTHGEFATFKRCRRQWWLAYYRRLGLPTTDRVGAGPLGTRVHRALAAWYVPEGQDPGNPYEVLERSIAEDVAALQDDPNALAELMKEAELARAMVEGYFEWLQQTGADEGLEVVGSEQRLEVDSGYQGVHIMGKLDTRLLRKIDDAVLVNDFKTCGSFEDTKWLHMREQILHYLLLEYLTLKERGLEHERSTGGLWTMLRKVKRTATAKPPFYMRVEVRHSLETLRSYWRHLIAGLQAIEHTRMLLDQGWDHHDVVYPTPTRDCSWQCDFFHVCSMFDDGSRVEDFVAENLVTINPLKRYEPEGVA